MVKRAKAETELEQVPAIDLASLPESPYRSAVLESLGMTELLKSACGRCPNGYWHVGQNTRSLSLYCRSMSALMVEPVEDCESWRQTIDEMLESETNPRAESLRRSRHERKGNSPFSRYGRTNRPGCVCPR